MARNPHTMAARRATAKRMRRLKREPVADSLCRLLTHRHDRFPVSPDEIKVLDIEAPDAVALNTGTPRPFPRIMAMCWCPATRAIS